MKSLLANWSEWLGTRFDVLRRYRAEFWVARVPTIISVALFVIVLAVPQCRDAVRALLQDSVGREAENPVRVLAGYVVCTTAGALAMWFWGRQCLRLLRPDKIVPRDRLAAHLPRIIATLPFGALAWQSLRVKAADVDFAGHLKLAGLTIVLGGLIYFTLWKRRRLPLLSRTDSEIAYLVMGYGVAFLAAVVLVLSLWFREYAYFCGPFGVLWLGAALWTTVFSSLVIHGTKHRIPWLWLLAIFAAIIGRYNWSDNHRIRYEKDPAGAAPEMQSAANTSIVDGFRAWKKAHKQRRVVFVAAEGGGIYAAYHTGYLLARLQQSSHGRFGDRTFLISTVSGGTVGAGVFVSLLAVDKERPVDTPALDYVAATRTIIDKDMLSPLIAAAIGPDALQRFVPLRIPSFDRARALEDTLTSGWNEMIKKNLPSAGTRVDWSSTGNFWDLWLRHVGNEVTFRTEVPVHLINTTIVETGERAIISPYGIPSSGAFVGPVVAHLWNGTEGLRIPIPTALVLSARFPFVTPPGRIENISLRAVDAQSERRANWRFADAGYFDNSGIESLLDTVHGLYAATEPNGGPLLNKADVSVLVIRSLADEKVGNDEGFGDSLTPIRTLLRTRNARENLTQARLMAAVDPRHVVQSAIATNGDASHRTPDTNPIAKSDDEPDIPLGWMLSASSKAHIRQQVDAELNSVVEKLGLATDDVDSRDLSVTTQSSPANAAPVGDGVATSQRNAPPDPQASKDEHDLKVKELYLSLFTTLGAILAFGVGLKQYAKAEKWKRAEFLANEMKNFFADPDVQNVLTMIDWASRRINLFQAKDLDARKYPVVTRALQISALRPHTLSGFDDAITANVQPPAGAALTEADSAEPGLSHFTYEETRIRDAYDRFLDYLERFSTYLQSHLITSDDLSTYLRYWIVDIAADGADPSEAAWTCALLAYVEFYGFTNVQRLFYSFGFDITTSGPVFERQMRTSDAVHALGAKLRDTCRHTRY